MIRRRLNIPLLLGTTLVLLFLAVGVHFLHAWQMNRHAASQLVLARQAESAGDNPRLLASLNRYLSFDPDSQDVRSEYALSLAEAASKPRERWRALQVLRQAISGGKALVEIHKAAARLALELDEPEEAVRCLEPLFRQPVSDPELLEFAARCYFAAGKFERAADKLEQTLRIAPDRLTCAELLDEVLRHRLHQPQVADTALDRFVADNPKRAEAWLLRARIRKAGERWDAASRDLTQARKLSPGNLAVLAASADLAARRGQWNEAVGFWDEARRSTPNDPAVYLGLAQAQKEAEQVEAGIKTLRDALARMPDQIELQFALADLLIDAGALDESTVLRKKLPEAGTRGRIQFLEGRLAQKHKQWLEAARFYVDAIQQSDIQPELGSRLMLELARCYAALGARDEQYLALMQAARLSPSPRVRLQLSEMLVAAGRGDDALPLLRSLAGLSTPPRDTWGLLARALLDHHRSRPSWQRRWREMEDALEKAARDPSQTVPATIMRAEMLWMRQQTDEAEQILEETLNTHRKEAVLYLALADLATRRGDEARAREVLRQGDAVLGEKLDWLQARSGRLAGHRDAESYRELIRLEERASQLPPADRDQLERTLADIHARLDNQKDVERLTVPLLIRHPQDIRARLLRVDAMLARNDMTGAQRTVEQIRTLEGDQGLAWRCGAVAVKLAEVRQGRREALNEARNLIAEIQKIRPAWSQVAFLGGRLADAEDRPDLAIENYQRVLALGDMHPYALTRLVQLLSEKNRWGEATSLLEKAQRNGVLDRDFLRPAAWIALRAGKPDRARELARLAVPPGTRSYRDLVWLGRLLDAADRPTEAGQAYQEAIQLAPDVPEVWLAQVRHLVRFRQGPEALETLTRMRNEIPAERRDLTLGQAEEILGRFDEAEKSYREVLTQKPNDATGLTLLANLLLRRNKPAEAEPILRRLLDPRVTLAEEELPDVRRQLALAITSPELAEDRVDEALALLASNTLQSPSEADRRVEALVRGTRATERSGALSLLASLRGGPALVPQERLRYAQLLDAAGDWPGSRNQLRTLLGEDEGNTALVVLLIDGLLRNDKMVEARGWLNKLLRFDPQCPRIEEFQQRLRVASPGRR
ncbi:MAG: tetratricopeptide repeat protein [Gemmataceae bacterium]